MSEHVINASINNVEPDSLGPFESAAIASAVTYLVTCADPMEPPASTAESRAALAAERLAVRRRSVARAKRRIAARTGATPDSATSDTKSKGSK